jgi:adenylate cyclase
MRAPSWHKTLLAAITIGLVSGTIALIVTDFRPFRTLELKWIDLMFELRGPLDVGESKIVLVAISEQANFELPVKYPYPTEYYARIVTNLNRAGAAVIGIDIVFDKQDIYNLRNDTLFAETLARYGNVVLAGDVRREVQRAVGVHLMSLAEGQQLVQPIEILRQSNPNNWGFVAVDRDIDGFLRRYPLKTDHFESSFYSLGIQILKTYFGLGADDVGFTPQGFRLGERYLPRWDDRNIYINYVGQPGSFPEFNFSDIIDTEDFFTLNEDEDFEVNAFDDPDFGLLHQDVFRDKIVLVGSTLPELHDFYPTPFATFGNMPGFESHANAIHTILSENFITKLPLGWTIILIFSCSLVAALLSMYAGVRMGVVVWALLLTGYIYTVYLLFSDNRIIIEMIGPSSALVLGYIGTVVYNYLGEQREKKRIRDMFGSYVAPEVVKNIIESGEEPRLGGQLTEITAFFSDIQSFSAFSEKLSPEELVELMNEYLTAMTDILIEERGTLDKYIGDAIVAIFGAPVNLPDHAFRACVTARRMIVRQAELREKWKSEGERWPEIVHHMQTRIGLNSGEVITGNMGSLKRFNYTMMGDNVNLAARCESGSKSYGVYVMVTDATRVMAEAASNALVFRELDRIIVKGRSIPVKMHEIVGFRNELDSSDFECLEHYRQGLEAYLKQQWDSAEKSFRAASVLERYRPDPQRGILTNPSLVMLDRIDSMRHFPPGNDWDGVYIMKVK